MLQKVTLAGNYFSAEGKRFIPIGVNWVPAREAMQWPYEWNPESIEADFSKMAEMGINFLRFDLVWQWFEPRPGQYNEEAFKQLDFFIELAHRYCIYLNPNFFIGGQVGDAYWDVPWRHNRHPHADPDMLGYFCQPTLVADVPFDHHLWKDEMFVPITTIGRVNSLEEAMREANAVNYGLTSGFYGDDDEIDSGTSNTARQA